MHARMHTHIRVYTHERAHKQAHIRRHPNILADASTISYTLAHLDARTPARLQNWNTLAHILACMCTRTLTHAQKKLHTLHHNCTCTNTHIHMQTHAPAYAHANICRTCNITPTTCLTLEKPSENSSQNFYVTFSALILTLSP